MGHTEFFVLLSTICFAGDKSFGGYVFAALAVVSFFLSLVFQSKFYALMEASSMSKRSLDEMSEEKLGRIPKRFPVHRTAPDKCRKRSTDISPKLGLSVRRTSANAKARTLPVC